MNVQSGRAVVQRAAPSTQWQAWAIGNTKKQAFKHGKHIALLNIPSTATTADVQRAVTRANLGGVQDVALVYSHFRPTGTALISLTRNSFLSKENLRKLDSASIAGIPVKAVPRLLDPGDTQPPRTRGAKGREEAAVRGALKGDGPHAGIPNGEKTVTIWGFPGKTESAAVEFVVRDFDLARSSDGKANVYKILAPPGQFSMFSRFIVQLSSVSEAHQLVRRINMTYFEPETLSDRFLLRARIIH
ncbi:hypothetical protein AX15_004915 [Amanita polypyramis BW_CC]|nr:hypothetical protein AX15_004915 [Amanita polypyramis BW_CC]